MNFFFSFSTKDYFCNLTIPKFKNYTLPNKKIRLYKIEILNNQWKLVDFNFIEDDNFFYVKSSSKKKNFNIFFLSSEKNIISKKKKLENELIFIDNFTDTFPDFRSKLQINDNFEGFSSYQSEYPLQMVIKNGNVISNVSILLNENARKNILFFVNIHKQPVNKKFNMYMLDLKKEEVLYKHTFLTNYVNEVEISTELIKNKNIYIYTENYLGIPIFLSEHSNQLSFEHSQPMQEFLLQSEKFLDVKKIKNKFNEIIIKKSI